ncbi:protein import receptor MAS20 [Aulographum hederae CBS 113979]|uniref:Mitochondrial import receptor subunit TOM20 n=1 Tax=Aulographum hederae CBS 113979 TaxID=1176131 RepID=A0A6G1HCL5_9PEZI|nr:protein import receptor MAS20 [Aulographum hederae CBS 113979]
MKTSTLIIATAGTVITGLVAYALYFDHRRRTDPDFRKALKRDAKRQAKAAKEAAEQEDQEQARRIKKVVEEANEAGYPKDPEVVESYFMQEVARGEAACQDGTDPVDAALCFYNALKVYPQPRELINIYDKTVPKPILDILAKMIAQDPHISTRASSDAGAVDD